MGGMLATRFALMFPDRSDALVLVNPIGLEDWQRKQVPALKVLREPWRELVGAFKRYESCLLLRRAYCCRVPRTPTLAWTAAPRSLFHTARQREEVPTAGARN